MSTEENIVNDLAKQLGGLDLETKPLSAALEMPSMAPLTTEPDFLVTEYNSPISLLNNGFYEFHKKKDNYVSIKERAMGWAKDLGVDEATVAETESKFREHVIAFIAEAQPFDRIFLRDSERAFHYPAHRAALCHALTFLQVTCLNNDYHQGLSMIVSFLMALLPLPVVIAMVQAIQGNSAISGVWKSQSLVAAVDGHIVRQLLHKHAPLVAAQLDKHGVIPEMYASKYWCAFGLHILPYQSLPFFFDEFCKEDVIALFRVLLTVVMAQEEKILQNHRIDLLVELVSIDYKVYSPEYANSVVYNVDVNGERLPHSVVQQEVRDKIEVILEELKDKKVLAALRAKTYEENYGQRAKASEEDFQVSTKDCQCTECEDVTDNGHYYCMECKEFLCENCAYTTRDGHNDDDHLVQAVSEMEPEDFE